ncbi:MAG TPA: hypothetical protein V6D46_00025, partial [Coleofasciculaceae cyanobacterium]
MGPFARAIARGGDRTPPGRARPPPPSAGQSRAAGRSTWLQSGPVALVVVGVSSPEFPIIVQLKNEFDPSQPLEPGDPVYVDCTSVRGDDDITV